MLAPLVTEPTAKEWDSEIALMLISVLVGKVRLARSHEEVAAPRGSPTAKMASAPATGVPYTAN